MAIEEHSSPIPVTVFTGYLGSGKTTIILQLLKQLTDQRVCLLKNEYGDIKVDSELAKHSALAGVEEMLNGCLCCVLIGRMGDAVCEIISKYRPDRILIETSGSAFPATISLEIRRLEGVFLDGIITVIDSENFKRHEDISYAAKASAQYTDLIVMNKVELVSERGYDYALDGVLELNDCTPIIKSANGWIDKELAFGLQTAESYGTAGIMGHHDDEIDVISLHSTQQQSRECIEAILKELSREVFYRIKGFVQLDEPVILNYAFGRWMWLPGPDIRGVQLTIMIAKGEAQKAHKLLDGFDQCELKFEKVSGSQ